MARPNVIGGGTAEGRESRFSAKVLEAFGAAKLPQTFAVRAATADAPAEILLYDEIGPWGVSGKDFIGAMAQAGAGPLVVRVNSPGGSVFDGMAIYNAIRAHGAGVRVVVDGVALSAASVIALAGEQLDMAETSMFMIHNAWGVVVGNKAELAAMGDVLGKIDGQMAAIYAAKTGKPVADMSAMMDAETWLTANEAKAGGFCDNIVQPVDAKAAKPKGRASARIAAALRAAFDPDGDGDDDAAEAVALIQQAIGSCADAIEALTGTEDDDSGASALMTTAQRENLSRRVRIALAQQA